MKENQVPRRLRTVLVSALMGIAAAATATAADVAVSAIPILEDVSTLRVEISADIDPGLRTFAVALSYDPAVLQVIEATKNELDWHLGSYPYGTPDTEIEGEVVIWGAHFDPANPELGVSGAGVLLGVVRFSILTADDPSLALTWGQTGDYKNFVTVDGTALDDEPDGVTFAVFENDSVFEDGFESGDVSRWSGSTG